MPESFEDFRLSFSYGSRSNLDFKFFKGMTDADAAAFFEELLGKISEAYDTGDIMPILQLAIDAQVAAYTPAADAPRQWAYDDRPFTPLRRPLAESRLGLMTSSGHFVADDDPEPFGVKGMTQQEAEDRVQEFLRAAPLLSSIPRDTPADQLVVRHGGYDVSSVRQDPNVAFPRDLLVEAEQEGRIGALADTLYSFPGTTAQGKVRQAAADWRDQLIGEEIDVLLLVPV